MINKAVTEIRSSTILTKIHITVTLNTMGVRFIRYGFLSVNVFKNIDFRKCCALKNIFNIIKVSTD